MTIRITWTDPNGPLTQEEEVRIYRDTAPFDAGSLPAVLATLAADVVTYDDTTALADTSYWYAVGFEKDGRLVITTTSQVYLTPGLFTESATFFGPTVSQATQTLTPALFSEAGAFLAATIVPGEVTLTAGLFSEAGGFFSALVEQPYTPVSEPAPSSAMLAEYSAADEFTHDWANLTGWTVANVQVSSNRLYGISSGANPSACYYPFAVDATESARLTCEIVRVTGVNRAIYVGFETVGGTILASLPNFCGIGIDGGDDMQVFIGSNFTGVSTGAIDVVGLSGGGTYTVTVSADPDYVSLVVRRADSTAEGRYIIPRSSLPGGGDIAGIVVWNTDTRGTSGSYAKGIGVRKSLTPFVTKTVTGGVIEGTSAQVIHRGTSGNYWRIHLPKAMDGTFAHPICLFTHQASTGTRNSVWDETRARPVLEALDAAGYIVISADDSGDRWGNQDSVDNYLEAVQWVRDNFYAGPLVLWAPSMGATAAWNIILRREAHVRAIAAICPVCDTEEMYRSPFVAGLDAAYGVSDLTGLQAALAASGGYNPIDGDMVEFTDKGVKFWVGTGTTDAIVPEALHAVLMQAALAPYAAESTLIETGSGHLATGQYDATAIVALFDTYT